MGKRKKLVLGGLLALLLIVGSTPSSGKSYLFSKAQIVREGCNYIIRDLQGYQDGPSPVAVGEINIDYFEMMMERQKATFLIIKKPEKLPRSFGWVYRDRDGKKIEVDLLFLEDPEWINHYILFARRDSESTLIQIAPKGSKVLQRTFSYGKTDYAWPSRSLIVTIRSEVDLINNPLVLETYLSTYPPTWTIDQSDLAREKLERDETPRLIKMLWKYEERRKVEDPILEMDAGYEQCHFEILLRSLSGLPRDKCHAALEPDQSERGKKLEALIEEALNGHPEKPWQGIQRGPEEFIVQFMVQRRINVDEVPYELSYRLMMDLFENP